MEPRLKRELLMALLFILSSIRILKAYSALTSLRNGCWSTECIHVCPATHHHQTSRITRTVVGEIAQRNSFEYKVNTTDQFTTVTTRSTKRVITSFE